MVSKWEVLYLLTDNVRKFKFQWVTRCGAVQSQLLLFYDYFVSRCYSANPTPPRHQHIIVVNPPHHNHHGDFSDHHADWLTDRLTGLTDTDHREHGGFVVSRKIRKSKSSTKYCPMSVNNRTMYLALTTFTF